MRKVTCASCGRPYDYDSDDFCPKCGSYNPRRTAQGPARRRLRPPAFRPLPRTGRARRPSPRPHRWAPGRCPTAAPREGRPGRSPPHGGSAPRSSFWCSCSCRCSSSALSCPSCWVLCLTCPKPLRAAAQSRGRLPRRSPPAGLTPFGSPFPFTVPSR